MGSGSTRLRTKIIALLTSLVALWSFAAWVTVRDGFNLLWVQTLNSRVADPGESLLTALQEERRLANAYLGERGQRQLDALTTQWQRTDQVADEFGTSVGSWQAELATGEDTRRRVDEVLTGLSGLTGIRESVRDAGLNRGEASTAYTAVLASVLRMYGSLGQLDDTQIAAASETLVDLYQVRELISQQDALITGVLAAGRMTGDEYARFTQLVGAQRYQTAEAVAELSPADRIRYDQLAGSDAVARFRVLEDRVIQQSRSATTLPLTAEEWQSTIGPAMQAQVEFGVSVGDALIDRATPVAVGVIVRLVLAAGLGLIAVIASIVVSITTARHLVAPAGAAAGRRTASWPTSGCPAWWSGSATARRSTSARRRRRSTSATTRSARWARRSTPCSETAIRTAVEQAELRRERPRRVPQPGPAHARRWCTASSPCSTRWSGGRHDPEELEDLFRVDHLATRMRRNAENLIVLVRRHPRPGLAAPGADGRRGARRGRRGRGLHPGRRAADGRGRARRPRRRRRHPPARRADRERDCRSRRRTPRSRCGGQLVANGFAIEIEDRGLGMSAEDLAAANQRIADPPEFEPGRHRPARPVRGRAGWPSGTASRCSSRRPPTAARPPSC